MENGQGFASSRRQLFGVPLNRSAPADLTRISKRARALASGNNRSKPVRPKSLKVPRGNGSGFFEMLFPVFMTAIVKKGG